MTKSRWLYVAATIACWAAAGAFADTVTVRTFGNGKTSAAALADAKRQAVIDAHVAVNGRAPASDPTPDTHELAKLRVLRRQKLDSGTYEVEIEARVAVASNRSPSPRTKLAVIVDPDAAESDLARRVLEAAVEVLASERNLVVIDDVEGKSARLLEQARNRGKRVTDHVATEFDLLYVLSVEAPVANAGGVRQIVTRVASVDVHRRSIDLVTMVRGRAPGNFVEPSPILARDAGRRVATVIAEQAARSGANSERVRVIRLPTGDVGLQIGQLVSVHNADDPRSLPGSRQLTTGEVIGLDATTASIWLAQPLKRSGRYVVRLLPGFATRSVISDSDW